MNLHFPLTKLICVLHENTVVFQKMFIDLFTLPFAVYDFTNNTNLHFIHLEVNDDCANKTKNIDTKDLKFDLQILFIK